MPFRFYAFNTRREKRTMRVKMGEQLRQIWRQATDGGESRETLEAGAASVDAARKTLALPSILSPIRFPGQHLPKPTPANLRRFAETPVVRRAINVIKDRIAAMDWHIRVRRGVQLEKVAYVERKLRALRRMLEEPNATDSFRTLIEQVIEDALTGGFGAVEMEITGEPERPAMLWPVDGASIRINAKWNGDPETPRYAQVALGQVPANAVDLLDNQLMYIRMNPRSFTPFGLGPLEVAFETVNEFLSAHRFAGKLAANAVAQYAIWLNEATPQQHDRLIRWWQDEIEGTGRVPVLSTEQKPEVLRFAQGTDADLRLAWQQFLIRMVANAFGLSPLMLGLEADVNQSTASEMADEAFRGAIQPLATLLAQHITRDLFDKCIGWREFEFVFNDLSARDEQTELQVQVQLLQAGVLTVDEVRAMRGLGPLPQKGEPNLAAASQD
jgi:HK97 family phage portal protein